MCEINLKLTFNVNIRLVWKYYKKPQSINRILRDFGRLSIFFLFISVSLTDYSNKEYSNLTVESLNIVSAKAGIRNNYRWLRKMDSRLCGNDEEINCFVVNIRLDAEK